MISVQNSDQSDLEVRRLLDYEQKPRLVYPLTTSHANGDFGKYGRVSGEKHDLVAKVLLNAVLRASNMNAPHALRLKQASDRRCVPVFANAHWVPSAEDQVSQTGWCAYQLSAPCRHHVTE